MTRVIEVFVTPEGDVTLQTKGYAGSACLEASRFLEQALGVASAECKTHEYYETATQEQQVQQ